MLQAAIKAQKSNENESVYPASAQVIIGNFGKQKRPVRSETRSEGSSEKRSNAEVDALLVKRFQQGERGAFDVLVYKHQQSVARVVAMYVHDHDSVKDVVQEAFIRAYKGLHNFRNDSQFYTWLYRIAVNTAFNFLKSSKRQRNMVDLDDASIQSEVTGLTTIDGPEKQLLNDDLGMAIKRAINRLPISLKTALLLREQDGLSYEQIADIVGCRVGTVKSRISRAREQLVQATKHLYRH